MYKICSICLVMIILRICPDIMMNRAIKSAVHPQFQTQHNNKIESISNDTSPLSSIRTQITQDRCLCSSGVEHSCHAFPTNVLLGQADFWESSRQTLRRKQSPIC